MTRYFRLTSSQLLTENFAATPPAYAVALVRFVDERSHPVGKPIIPDKELPVLEASKKIHKEAYHVMQVMCGINPSDKTYNENQDIDSYVKTM